MLDIHLTASQPLIIHVHWLLIIANSYKISDQTNYVVQKRMTYLWPDFIDANQTTEQTYDQV